MAEIILPPTPKIVGADGLEASYKQGQPKQEQPKQEGPTQAEQEKYLNEILPFYRKKAELYKLIKEIHEGQVLMGELPSNRVPGLLGLELTVREYQAKGYLGEVHMQLENLRREDAIKQHAAQGTPEEQTAVPTETVTGQ